MQISSLHHTLLMELWVGCRLLSPCKQLQKLGKEPLPPHPRNDHKKFYRCRSTPCPRKDSQPDRSRGNTLRCLSYFRIVWDLLNFQAKTPGCDEYFGVGEMFCNLRCSIKQNTATKSSRHVRVHDPNSRSMHCEKHWL